VHPPYVRLGVTAKTLANHKSNVRAALRWFNKECDVPVRGVPLLPEWAKLRDGIRDRGQRARLYGLMRYETTVPPVPPTVPTPLRQL
jgi:hypothetical protein